MKFKVEYNRRFGVSCRLNGVRKEDAGRSIDIYGDLRPECVPQNIFKDFVAACGEGRKLTETLLWRAIRPDIPSKYSHKWGYWMIIHGHGVAPNYLADIQTGPYKDRYPTKEEARFTAWFKTLVKTKYDNSRLPGSREKEIKEMEEVVL